jgi:hypothetical protein
MSYKNVQIDIYNNIFDAKDRLQAWAGTAGFPLETGTDAIPVAELTTLFITFPGVFGMEKTTEAGKPNAALKRFDLFINRFLDTLLAPAYLLLLEPGKELGNKIRTNKGWLPGKIKTLATCLEVEVPLADTYTIFVAAIKLMERNKQELLAAYAHSSTTCVIIDPKNKEADLFNKEFLGSFPEKYTAAGTINFLQLATDLYSGEKAVYCFGGADGQELSCKIFCHQRLKDTIVQQAEQALERNYSIEEV